MATPLDLKKDVSDNSPSFDFLLVNYDYKKNGYKILSYDVTVTQVKK